MFQRQFSQPILAIDISDYSVEVLTMTKRGRKPKVTAYNRAILGKGVVSDGIIHEPRVLALTIHKALRSAEPKAIASRLCLVSLPVSQTLSYSFTLPGALGKSDMRKAVINEVHHALPIRLQETCYDFQVKQRGKNVLDVFFAAAKKKVIYKYLDVFEKAKLYPLAFDVESASMYRALKLKPDGRIKVLIDLGARTTNVYVFSQGLLRSTYTVQSAGIDLTKAVAKRLSVPFEKAEKIKQQVGLNPNKFEAQVFSALLPPLHDIALQVKTHLSRYKLEHKKHARAIELVGGTALLKGITEYLSEIFEHRVVVANPLAAVTAYGVKMNARQSVLYANVLGLGLRGIEIDPYYVGVNLLSQARYRE